MTYKQIGKSKQSVEFIETDPDNLQAGRTVTRATAKTTQSSDILYSITDCIVNLIGATTTNTGLTVKCVLDYNEYAKGISVSDEDLAKVNLLRDDFHGEWNYSILPSL